MSTRTIQLGWGRRSFLSRFGIGAAAIGAAVAGGSSIAEAQPPGAGAPFQPARHAEDDWYDQTPAKHRVFFDTTTAEGVGRALLFGNNTFSTNRSAYGLTDGDTALVICVRHEATPFAFTDAMWAKYGRALSARSNTFVDPKTKEAPVVNVYRTSGYALPNMGVLIDAVTGHGARFAVCTLATRAAASVAAQQTGGKADDIFKELTENLVPNARMVPAGIVAVNRSQEHGYTITHVG